MAEDPDSLSREYALVSFSPNFGDSAIMNERPQLVRAQAGGVCVYGAAANRRVTSKSHGTHL